MPAQPKLPDVSKVQYKGWDQYVQEVAAEIEPFQLPVSETETLVIPCPTGAALRDIAGAQITGDFELLVNSVFGDQADRVWELAAHAGFPTINRLASDVMTHYGRPQAQLGE